MTIQEKSYKDLCKEFSDAVCSLKRRQRFATFSAIINLIAFVLNILCIYMSIRG